MNLILNYSRAQSGQTSPQPLHTTVTDPSDALEINTQLKFMQKSCSEGATPVSFNIHCVCEKLPLYTSSQNIKPLKKTALKTLSRTHITKVKSGNRILFSVISCYIAETIS